VTRFVSPRSWDAVLVATYDDLDSLEAYQRHEAHAPVARRLKDLCESIGSVDYPIETTSRW
jgi:Stress responsive A/B Barrel Domain